MTIRLVRHYTYGGVFVLDDTARKMLAVLVKPPHDVWTDQTTNAWLTHDLNERDMTVLLLPVNTPTGFAFEFKDKQFIVLGLNEDGAKRIRWVERLHSPQHDNVIEQFSGEEDEPSPVSE